MKGSLSSRSALRACLPWVAVLLAVGSACSSDGGKPSLGDPSDGGESGSGGSGKGGSKSTAGTSSTEGGSASDAGAPSEAGAASGGEAPSGGTGGSGGSGGSNGEGGGAGEPVQAGPPDLVTKNGGPWPDSLSGVCTDGKRVSVCPQLDDASFGQDGTYRINVPSYSATATTVTDSVTGLVWQIAPSKAEVSHADALAYCDALELGGQSDWRVPSLLEYVSLLDEGLGSGYALPAEIPIDQTGKYWTASTSVGEDSFFTVDDEHGAWNVGIGVTTFRTRCVRGAPLTGSLQVGTGVVADSMTQLTWQTSELTDTPRTWLESLDYCETLSLGGKDDWRLPSIKELVTLIDPAATVAPALRAELGSSPAASYWSSTPAPPFVQSVTAFALDSSIGLSTTIQVDEGRAARCVRTTD